MNLVGVSEGLGELVGRKDKATLFFPFAPGPLQIDQDWNIGMWLVHGVKGEGVRETI